MAKHEVEDWETDWDKAQTKEERDEALRKYSDAKLRNAARREEERLNHPGKFDKFLDAIFNLKKKIAKKKDNSKAIAKDNQNSR